MSVFVLTAVKLRGSTLLDVIALQVEGTETARWLQWRHSVMTSSLCDAAVNKLKSYTTPRVSRYHTHAALSNIWYNCGSWTGPDLV